MRFIPAHKLNLYPLVRKNPENTIRFLLSIGAARHPYYGVDQLVHRFTTETILELIRQGVLRADSYYLIQSKRLRRAQVVAIYDVFGQGWYDEDGSLPVEFLKGLHQELREHEAHRHWNLPALLTQPARRLPYAGLLSWDEAGSLLESYIHNPDATLRQQALATLIGTVRYDREHAGDALALIVTHRNEQGSVRQAMLVALRDLSPGVWKEEHLNDLAQIICDALDAPDASYWTIQAPHEIVLRILPFHPLWAINLLPNVMDKQAQSRFH